MEFLLSAAVLATDEDSLVEAVRRCRWTRSRSRSCRTRRDAQNRYRRSVRIGISGEGEAKAALSRHPRSVRAAQPDARITGVLRPAHWVTHGRETIVGVLARSVVRTAAHVRASGHSRRSVGRRRAFAFHPSTTRRRRRCSRRFRAAQ
jgi:hypothetical protein